MNQFSGTKKAVFFKEGVMDFEKFRKACLRHGKHNIRDGYAEDFAQFCVLRYLETGFFGYRKLTRDFYHSEFIGGTYCNPKNDRKRAAAHVPIPLGLVDERTVMMLRDFENRYAIPNENGRVQTPLFLAFKNAIAKQRKSLIDKKNYYRKRGPLKPRAVGSTHGMSRLKEEQVIEIKKLLLQKIRCAEIAIKFGVARSTITSIMGGKTWTHISITLLLVFSACAHQPAPESQFEHDLRTRHFNHDRATNPGFLAFCKTHSEMKECEK